MKRLAIAFIIALLALVFVAVPALAYGPDWGADADVECSEPGVSDENPTVGDTVYFYGTITYDISAHNNENYWDGYSHSQHSWYQTGAYVILDASGHYAVVGPDGIPVAEDGFDWSSGYIMGDTGSICGFPWDDDVQYGIADSWNWETAVIVDQAGEYTYSHDGDASAEYGHWIQYGHYEGHGCHRHFVPDGPPVYYADGDPAYDACFSKPRVVIAHAAGAMLNKPHPVLTIILPDGKGIFFGSDGWDDPTDQNIVFTDGTWQIEIAAGTLIELDGKWHMLTTIIVDDQGQVTCEYGKSETVATDIGLSQPLAITKVG
jgi:hypothetical protein